MPSSTRPLTAVLAALLAAGVLAACGGDDSGSDTASAPATTEQTTATTETEATTEAEGGSESASAEGEQLFTENCASCHTLAAADASGQVGPNLDDAQPSETAVAAKVKAGGGGMPAFEGQLTEAQITALSAYVAENAGKS
jgi:mono/diheme cytochrome c family protein